MATWTTIPDSSLEPGKPIRSIDALALRDNPVAIAEGASGAPKIWGNASKRLSTYPVITVSASDAKNAEIGSGGELLTTSTTTTGSTPTVVAQRYTIALYTGSMRFKASHYSSTSALSYLSLYKNGSLVQAYTTSSTTPVSRVNDVTVAPGDVFEWRHSTAATTSYVTGRSISASDAYVEIKSYIKGSDL